MVANGRIAACCLFVYNVRPKYTDRGYAEVSPSMSSKVHLSVRWDPALCNPWSMELNIKNGTQTASQSVHPFLKNSPMSPADRSTDKPRYSAKSDAERAMDTGS